MASVNGTAVGISVTVMGLICTSDKATLHTPFMELVQSPDGGSLFMFLRYWDQVLLKLVSYFC